MSTQYDVVIVGGGITGLIFLKYARERNLKAVLLERESGAGGIWRKLPEWQDIQTPIEDWAINDTPISGATQPHILANICSWIGKYRLEEDIRFSTPVTGAQHDSGGWICHTPQQSFRSKYLVVATGLHNLPRHPKIHRSNVTIPETHSSQLFDLAALDVRRVAVIGGSASAFDVLDKAIERGVPEIHWVIGTPAWMLPSRQSKTQKRSLRVLASRLIREHSRDEVNAGLKTRLQQKYRYFKIEEILPPGDPDLWSEAVVNGRPRLIENLSKIIRHPGHMTGLQGNTVKVGDTAIDCDLVIYATGYELDLSFLGLERIAHLKNRKDLQRRCGTAVKSLDYPNLFFLGPTILDTNSSTPFYSATVAKTVVAHMLGKTVIPDTVIEDNVPHWAAIRLLSSFDRFNYGPLWRIKYFFLAWYYERYPLKQVRV